MAPLDPTLIELVIVELLPVFSKVPPLMVIAPVERLVPLAPPVDTDKTPPVIVVPPE